MKNCLFVLSSAKTNDIMAYSPTTIANYFIEKYHKKGNFTAMKLLKLTYIAYGWYLALKENKEKLIYEQPLAWDYGPVFPSLYAAIKSQGIWNIDKKLPTLVKEDISKEDSEFLDKIFEQYGGFDGIKLSAMTHQKDSPWEKVYCEQCNSPIDDTDIYEHYSEMLQEN